MPTSALERFEEYAALEGGPVGYGGTKYAYADTIEFIPVPDEAARVAGLQAGDYLDAHDRRIGNDQYEVLKDYPTASSPRSTTPTDWPVFFLNWQSPVMGNLAMREAVQAALDMEPMMQSACGRPRFIQLDPGLMMKQTAWYTDAGSDRYNMNNPDLAKQKLEEAGYDGTPIRFMSTQEYRLHVRHLHRGRAAAGGGWLHDGPSRSSTGPPWSSGAPSRKSGTCS